MPPQNITMCHQYLADASPPVPPRLEPLLGNVEILVGPSKLEALARHAFVQFLLVLLLLFGTDLRLFLWFLGLSLAVLSLGLIGIGENQVVFLVARLLPHVIADM